MISRVTSSMASGIRADNSLRTDPATTTAGPDSHTMRRTGGTFRSALSRTFHALERFCTGVAVSMPGLKVSRGPQVLDQIRRKDGVRERKAEDGDGEVVGGHAPPRACHAIEAPSGSSASGKSKCCAYHEHDWDHNEEHLRETCTNAGEINEVESSHRSCHKDKEHCDQINVQ